MNRILLSFLLLASSLLQAQQKPLRAPAVPIIAHDPYFSVWSMNDNLNDETTKHWTGSTQALGALLRVDGATFRVMGKEGRQTPPVFPQTRVEVLPTRTVYEFAGSGVQLTLTFLTPALPEDLDVLSRPVTYVVWDVKSTDGREHAVSLYFDACAELAVNTSDQLVAWSRFQVGKLSVLRMGSQQQPMLEKDGDNLRIDWGYLYLAATPDKGVSQIMADRMAARSLFANTGGLVASDDMVGHKLGRNRMPVLAYSFDLGKVGATPVSRHLIVAYDDLYSLEYFERKVRPYWRRKGAEAKDMLEDAERDYVSLAERCRRFDEELMADLRKAGGEKYARLCALAHRQAIAAHKLVVDADGTPLYFPKENFSNGCIGTVDVFYPSAPMFLLMSPKLMRASVQPLLDYSMMQQRWRFAYAPHDLGRYPKANGQVYGGGERTDDNQMPVEESGNMLLLVAALAQVEGNADFAMRYWPSLKKWAEYLKEKGLDPENQLSTDDFAGHLPHNANLSIKAILALGAYGRLCEMTGKKQEAALYRKTAQDFAKQWIKLADDGDHYRLAFDKPGSWSQKYNLVWDRLLKLNIFPPEVARKEMAFYKKMQNGYGLPLDNREKYTKLDWILWTATLSENASDFEALLAPAYRFADESPTRVPLSDWYWTTDAKQRGFQARSVVGGLFIKMLADEAMWKKWVAKADHAPVN
jgi:hypothetical protein